MGIPLLSGRTFVDADVSGEPVAIITAETARRFWPNQNAVGKHIHLLDDKSWRTVVGVISDIRAFDLRQNIPTWMRGTAFVPYNSSAALEDRRIPAEMTIVVRTTSDESQAVTVLREAVSGLNQEVAVGEEKKMAEVVSEAVATPRSTATLFVFFAALALVLGTIGIYGVLSFLVSNRTQEIGIRMAMGAQRWDVLRSVMGEGAKLSLTGIAVGMAGAFVLMRVLSGELYGVGATDPLTFGGVAILVAVVAMTACYVPARRAMRVDPMVALRYE